METVTTPDPGPIRRDLATRVVPPVLAYQKFATLLVQSPWSSVHPALRYPACPKPYTRRRQALNAEAMLVRTRLRAGACGAERRERARIAAAYMCRYYTYNIYKDQRRLGQFPICFSIAQSFPSISIPLFGPLSTLVSAEEDEVPARGSSAASALGACLVSDARGRQPGHP